MDIWYGVIVPIEKLKEMVFGNENKIDAVYKYLSTRRSYFLIPNESDDYNLKYAMLCDPNKFIGMCLCDLFEYKFNMIANIAKNRSNCFVGVNITHKFNSKFLDMNKIENIIEQDLNIKFE